MCVCAVGNTPLALYLIMTGAHINVVDVQGHTALGLACHAGHIETAESLLSKGADPFAGAGLSAAPASCARLVSDHLAKLGLCAACGSTLSFACVKSRGASVFH